MILEKTQTKCLRKPKAPTQNPTKSPTILPLAHGQCLPSLIKSVKLQQTTGAYLHLFELQILDPTGANIALGKTATRSSVHLPPDVVGGYGIHAIDGNMTSFLHTGDASMGDPNPWLNIDLGAGYEVEKIVIHNRWCNDPSDVQNQCLCRMSQANLLLFDNSGAVVSTFSVGDTCGKATLSYDFCPTESPTKNPTKVRQ